MNIYRFATAFGAAQYYMARAKQNDWLREVNIKQLDELLAEMFENLPLELQVLIGVNAAQFQFPNNQPHAQKATAAD